VEGELSDIKKASLPIFAAIGGMLIPALIFIAFNHSTDYKNGWAIPMATDIAFSLAIISLLGKSVPNSLKIFLSALAIVDDLGAIIVIALFYTDSIDWLSSVFVAESHFY
jgi:NhaA family Na+:H+ antiporter